MRFLWLILAAVSAVHGQSIEGKWKTVDDRTGQPRALVDVRIFEGRLYGTIQKILEEGEEDVRCTACTGALYNQPVRGMQIIDAFERSGKGYFKGDRLLDPEQGKFFRGRVWLDPEDPDKLKVRGYLAFLYRTQTWERFEP